MKSPRAPSLKPNLLHDRCARVRFSGARCDACITGCPTDSIRIAQSTLTIDDKCSGCGFCVASCPNEVFSFLGAGPASFNEEKGSPLYCSGLLTTVAVPSDALPPSVIPCLGSISNTFILSWALREARPLEIFIGACDECQMSTGEKQYRRRERDLQSLFDYLGIGFSPANLVTASVVQREKVRERYEAFRAETERSRALSRRDFFRQMREAVVHHASQSGKNPASATHPGLHQRGPSAERRSLVELFRTYQKAMGGGRGVVPLCRELQVDEHCAGCGACANLCPTGALSLEEGHSEVHLNWTPAYCSSCDLCLDACVRKALHVTPCTDVRRIAGEVTSTIKAFHRLYCPSCGNIFFSADPDGRCTECLGTQQFIGAVSVMIYGEEEMASS